MQQYLKNTEKVSDQSEVILTTLKLLGIGPEKIDEALGSMPVILWAHDEKHRIVYGNREFFRSFGSCRKRKCHEVMGEPSGLCGCCKSEEIFSSNISAGCDICRRRNDGYDVSITHTPFTNKGGCRFILKSSFHIRNMELLKSRSIPSSKGCSDIIVLCCRCNRAKSNTNTWTAIDDKTISNFNARISHGLCQECAKILYPNL